MARRRGRSRQQALPRPTPGVIAGDAENLEAEQLQDPDFHADLPSMIPFDEPQSTLFYTEQPQATLWAQPDPPPIRDPSLADTPMHVDWTWQSGGWTNTMPEMYGYELTDSSSLSHPSQPFLTHAAAAAGTQIGLLEPESHVVAVRPLRGGETTSRRSREYRNMIQSIHISRPMISQRRSHIRLPASPSPPRAGPSGSHDLPVPPSSNPITAEPIGSHQTTAPIYRTLDKPTRSKIIAVAKRDIRKQMFTITAVPDTLSKRKEMIKQATRVARREILGDNYISTKNIAISGVLVHYMAAIRQSFRDAASRLVERHFGIRNTVEQAINQVEERRMRVITLLSTPNFGFLHTMHHNMYGDVETAFFSHPCIADIITDVVWKTHGSGKFATTGSFAPIMAVTVTAIIIALRELRTGQYQKSTLQGDQFQEIYEEVSASIESIHSNVLYLDTVGSMISYNNRLIPPGEDDSSSELVVQGADDML